MSSGAGGSRAVRVVVMARRPGGTRWQTVRATVLGRSTICHLCGHDGADVVDHVIPLKLGGPAWDLRNLAPAHGAPCPTCGLRCNRLKGSGAAGPLRTSRQW